MNDQSFIDLRRENDLLKRELEHKDQLIIEYSDMSASSHRQVKRQAANILVLCHRLRAAGLSDKIEEDEKPNLGGS